MVSFSAPIEPGGHLSQGRFISCIQGDKGGSMCPLAACQVPLIPRNQDAIVGYLGDGLPWTLTVRSFSHTRWMSPGDLLFNIVPMVNNAALYTQQAVRRVDLMLSILIVIKLKLKKKKKEEASRINRKSVGKQSSEPNRKHLFGEVREEVWSR